MNKTETGGMNALTRGVIVFVALAVLTALEYVAGVMEAGFIILAGLALIKAALVIWFFMHVGRVLNPDEGGH